MNRLVLAVGGVGLVAVIGIVVIPLPKPSPDFSRAPSVPITSLDPSASKLANADPGFRETRWGELMPKDWDPYKQLWEVQKGIRFRPDADPDGPAMLKKMREIWDSAPTNSAMNSVAVRIPGYVVPLDESKRGIKEFLLVPYFGACIHSPPPPSNQIIHVRSREPVPGIRSMDTVWISGTLKIVRSDSYMGASSYSMEAVAVETYTVAKRN